MAGRHKVFLGMAAGVGKTYRMLQEGQAEAEAGRDVVIGYLEPHDRPETTAQSVGLPLVPRRAGRRGVEELDLPGLLLRAPELCLIDELAHTNAPGLEHAKRWEDVDAVLAAGIDVFSTVNVQHLESLNDQVTDLTGTRVRETVPDAVLTRAAEVVLVDLTPEALLARLRAGKVYRPDRVEAALNGFFKVENLGALREIALRQVAAEVESQRLERAAPALLSATRREEGERLADGGAAAQAVGERLLALVRVDPAGQRVVRRAWRSAQRLGAELDLLTVSAPGADAGEQERVALEALRRLASVLGAPLLVEEGDDVADVVVRVARERGTTYVLLGAPTARRRFREPLPMQLLRRLPGVDVRVVADRAARPGSG